MTAHTHTPGPWTASQHPYGAKPWKVSAPGHTPYVAGSIARESNARLIAEAPAMLEALERAADCIEEETDSSGGIVAEIRVLIARATEAK